MSDCMRINAFEYNRLSVFSYCIKCFFLINFLYYFLTLFFHMIP